MGEGKSRGREVGKGRWGRDGVGVTEREGERKER